MTIHLAICVSLFDLFKLMACKDEYEVARLHIDRAFTEKIASMFEFDYKLVHYLAPPLTARRSDQGEQSKKPLGHVKDRHFATARPKWQALMDQWRNGLPKHDEATAMH